MFKQKPVSSRVYLAPDCEFDLARIIGVYYLNVIILVYSKGYVGSGNKDCVNKNRSQKRVFVSFSSLRVRSPFEVFGSSPFIFISPPLKFL